MQGLRRTVIGILLLLRCCAAYADEPKKDAHSAQHEVQTLLRSRQSEDRALAMRRLADLPPLDSVKLVVQVGLDDRAPEVRRAAYETLLTWKDQHDVADYLVKVVAKRGHSRATPTGNGPTLVPLLMVLAASGQADIRQELEKFTTWYLAASKNNLATLLAVADELGRQGDPPAVAALRNLCAWKQFTKVFAFRRAVVQGLTHCRQADAIDALVGLLGQIDGEAYGDVVQYLAEATKMPYGDEINAWKFWWQKRKKDFTFDQPPGAPPPEVVVVPRGSFSYYYGLPVRARRLVFVIDISGSMRGPKLDMAKRELTNVIGKLPPKNDFSIVVFDHQVIVWQRDLLPATAANKDSAIQYVGRLQSRGRTATYDALDAAFHFDTEAIFFLTDGEPTCGRVVDPAQIATLVTQANRLRRLSIYTIGLAPGPVGCVFDTFLKTLAEQNYGTYRRVEQ
jgi:hypothetical protein